MKIIIRNGAFEDLARINEIYNYYVLESTCTYQTMEESIEARQAWFKDREEKHPVIVAEIDEKVLGWGAISRFKERTAYEHTGEVSVYVDHGWLHCGLGKTILASLIEKAGKAGLHSLMAIISADQIPSVKLHEKYGFKTVAHLKEVGYKFGAWLDVVYMQYMVKKVNSGFFTKRGGQDGE
jgi:phosphinothricin acetyltransferase